ncbi:Mechanosensitive ion channel [Ekhidna lutea]|uniref:Mechanosensitive ion channel n=1 Tax=Ekhidna lutea TaxID=447679 RepID=A0A239JY83_EKHLU|nr:mechanosensitive ion channel domain-containing protein [Ekhidna lutea]SNT10383.1 Mechanosensitive ion channel [Ekhidna lutea]
MKNLFLVLTFSLCGIGTLAQAPSDSLKSDSIQRKLNSLSQQLDTYERILLQTKQKRKQDSLARVDLMKRIQLLQESGQVNQATLREQIREIEQRDSARNAEQKNRILRLKENNKGYAVAPIGDSLYTIYTKLGPVMPEDRAANVAEKIELLVRDDYFFPDSLNVVAHEGTVDLMYQNLIVTSISDWDALWIEGETKESLARIYKASISEFVVAERNRSTVKNIAARIGLVFLIIGVAILIIYFLNRFFTGVQGWMVINKKKYFAGITVGNYEFLPPERQLDVTVKIVGVLKWAFFALVLYFSLPIIFGLFPFTKNWAETLIGWILSPAQSIFLSFWNYLPNAFTIGVIYVITKYLIRFLKFISHEIETSRLKITGFHEDWAMPTYNIVKFLVYAFMFVVIFPYLPGSDSDIFKGVSVFLGILFSLGSSSAIANAVAGLVITYMRPFRLGDRVKIGEVTGQVIEKTLLVTRVRTTKNEDITVPNAAILNGHTVNYTSSSKELGLVLHTSVTIGYDVPWRQVHELLIEAAVATNGVNISKEPFVLQTSLDDWYVAYQLNAYTDLPEQMPKIYSELHANIQDKFNAAGVEIMSPHYRAVRDGNAITIPKDQDGKN